MRAIQFTKNEKSCIFQIQRLVLVPSLLRSLLMYLGLRVSIHLITFNYSIMYISRNFNFYLTQHRIRSKLLCIYFSGQIINKIR